MKLIATRRMTYATRRLLPGDIFAASASNSRALIAIGKAKAAPDDDNAPDLADLRNEYQQLSGKRPFHGWDAETLQAKIAEAKDAS